MPPIRCCSAPHLPGITRSATPSQLDGHCFARNFAFFLQKRPFFTHQAPSHPRHPETSVSRPPIHAQPPPYSHPLSRPCSRVNVNMNFLAHGAGHFLKIFATTSFNVWRCFLPPLLYKVWNLHPVKFGRPALPESAVALQRWGVRPRTTPGRRRGPASTSSTGPTAGTRAVRPSYRGLSYTFSSAIQTSAAHLRGSPSNRASSLCCRSAIQAPRTSYL